MTTQEARTRLETEELLQEKVREIQALLAGRGVGLRATLDALHPADIAYLLEALPPEQRLAVWDLVKADRDGEILLEVSDPVRESLISSMDTEELVAAAETLDAEEIAELAPDLPQEVMDDVFSSCLLYTSPSPRDS